MVCFRCRKPFRSGQWMQQLWSRRMKAWQVYHVPCIPPETWRRLDPDRRRFLSSRVAPGLTGVHADGSSLLASTIRPRLVDDDASDWTAH